MIGPRSAVLCLVPLVAVLAPMSAATPATPPTSGVVVRDGVLLRNGKPFRAIGINITAIADDVLDNGAAATESLGALRYLGEHKVPFIRFWASYFSGHSRWVKDPPRYWRNMDLLIGACEKAGLGIAPSLFWNDWAVPAELGEYRYAWTDEDSKTRKYMRRYVTDFVKRYGKRKCMWVYELSNENNLAWDLPNSMQFLPEGQKDARNIARAFIGTQAIGAFARAVRGAGATNPITSGTSAPRGSQYHLATEDPVTGKPWEADTPEQQYIAATWTAPAPVDLFGIHYYADYATYDPARVRRDVAQYMGFAARMHKPLYIGEFGVLPSDGKMPADFDATRYRERLRDLFEAVYESKAPLSCYWAYAGHPVHFGIGAVSRQYGKYEYILDIIREYNDRMGRDLAGESSAR